VLGKNRPPRAGPSDTIAKPNKQAAVQSVTVSNTRNSASAFTDRRHERADKLARSAAFPDACRDDNLQIRPIATARLHEIAPVTSIGVARLTRCALIRRFCVSVAPESLLRDSATPTLGGQELRGRCA
jgi:hypothetical protein